MYKWTDLYRLKVSHEPNIYQFFIFLGFFFTLDIDFADAKGPHVQATTIFSNNCSPSYNNAIRDIQNIIYQEDFEIQQELVYEPCGLTCYQQRKKRKCYDNSYLQDKLDPAYENQELNRSLDPRCTYRVLKIASNSSSGHFLDCASFNDPHPKKRRRNERPCFSKRLHHAIHQSITEISSCFRIDPKLLFSIIANESKAHPLAKNSTSTATGVGQIVSTYVDNYSNQSHITFDILKDEILPQLSRQNKDCRIVQNKINQFSKLEERPICQRTNHYVNMVYTMMGLVDNISQLTPTVIGGQGGSFEIPQNSPFQPLINKYKSDLEREQDRKSIIKRNLENLKNNSNNSDVTQRDRPRTATSARGLRSALDHSNGTIRSLEEKGRFFRNLARFHGLDANDKKLVSELSIYSYMLPRTRDLFQTYVDDRRSLEFENFTGPNGQWINFLNIEGIREQISTRRQLQGHFIGYVYEPGETSSGSSSIMNGLLNRLEQQSPPIPDRCRPY